MRAGRVGAWGGWEMHRGGVWGRVDDGLRW